MTKQTKTETAPTPAEMHNRLAGEIVKRLVKPTLDTGGEFSAVLVLLESVILGVMLVAPTYGYDEQALDTIIEQVKARLHKAQPFPPAGHA